MLILDLKLSVGTGYARKKNPRLMTSLIYIILAFKKM